MANEALRVVFLEGITTNLRPLSKDDIPNLYRWINDPAVRDFVVGTFPKTLDQEEAWIKSLGSDDKNIVFGIELKDGTLIGCMGLHHIDWKDRIATTGALIGEKQYWGRGFGTDAKMALLNYAFNTLNLHKICSEVIAYNKRSLQYSLHCGYKVEGVRKRHTFKRGRYYDRVELGIFKRDWLPIWRKYKKIGTTR